jgi:uncharacterized protein (DUF1697 family)
MNTWLALLRGINVQGRNKVPMKALASVLEADGLKGVRTYIQSGNVFFRSSSNNAGALGARIGRLIERHFGCSPTVVVIGKAELAAAISGNPFPEAALHPKCLHVYFLAQPPPSPDLASLERLDAGREACRLNGRVFYLWTPDGFADSVLGPRVERCLGVPATARNWRTVNELLKRQGSDDP